MLDNSFKGMCEHLLFCWLFTPAERFLINGPFQEPTTQRMERLKQGDWVKLSDGTRGMTVVDYVEGETNKVICSYTDEEGDLVKKEFDVANLVRI